METQKMDLLYQKIAEQIYDDLLIELQDVFDD